MKLVSVVVIAFLLSSCAVQRANIAKEAKVKMIGLTKAELLSCAGVPSRQDKTENMEFLTYEGGGDSVNSAVANSTSQTSAVAVGSSKRKYCQATFVLTDGKVSKINYQGRTGGLITKGEQCAFIVENCINNQ